MFGKYIWCILVILFITSCNKDSINHDVPIIAHAATGLYNPQQYFHDNSKEGIEYALSFTELDGIEVDIQRSKDGTFWLYHDDRLENNTNGTGQICEKYDSEIEGLNYSTLRREKLVRLTEVDFESFSAKKTLFLDLKTYSSCNYDSLIVDDIILSLGELALFELPHYDVKLIVNDIRFAYAIGLAGYTIYCDINSLANGKERLELYPYDGFFIRNRNITEKETKELLDFAVKVVIFDVRTPLSIRRAKQKRPTYLMVEEFKTALIEK